MWVPQLSQRRESPYPSSSYLLQQTEAAMHASLSIHFYQSSEHTNTPVLRTPIVVKGDSRAWVATFLFTAARTVGTHSGDRCQKVGLTDIY